MFSATSLLVLACVGAIAVDAKGLGSLGDDYCISTQYPSGPIPTHHPVVLPTAELPPYFIDYEVDIPDIPECEYGIAGAQAYVCDYDVVPTAKFANQYAILVNRNGNIQKAGSVKVTVYCN